MSISEIISNSISTCKQTRKAIEKISNNEIFNPIYNISIREEKERVLNQFKELSKHKIVSVKDFLSNPENIFTVHEMLSYYNGSLATKFTVQFNLFGGTIVGLGSKKHYSFFENIDDLSVIGCFCLTEVGYGNNAIEMETTSVWDNEKKVFVINTPTVKSQKFWITNGAYHANHAIVFAQTYIDNKNEGINAFLIRIRNDDGTLSKGVVIDDMGMKMGMNGVDNARIIFKDVSAGYDSLLDKISHINNEGKFISKIKGRRERFIYAANRLLSGRICIASMMISLQKQVLSIAVKYGKERLSNGSSGKSDTPIFDYQLFQNQIIPFIGRVLIYNISLLSIRKIYSDYLLNETKYESDIAKKNEIIRLCCVIKPIISWHANIVGNTVRERLGGQAFLSINKIEEAISSAHSGITAEGDSSVLMQKVSKEYVSDYIAGRVSKQNAKYSKSDLCLVEAIVDIDHMLSLIKHRENSILEDLSNKTMKAKGNEKEIYNIWMLNESNSIQSLAFCYGKRLSLEAFLASSLFDQQNEKQKHVFLKIALLDSLLFINESLGWYTINGYISSKAGLLIDEQISKYVKDLALYVNEIINGFDIPENSITAPIYTDYVKYYSVDKTDGEHYNRKAKF